MLKGTRIFICTLSGQWRGEASCGKTICKNVLYSEGNSGCFRIMIFATCN